MLEATSFSGKGAPLNDAARELDEIYNRVRNDPDADVGERLLVLEELLISQPAGSFEDVIARTRALISIGDVSRRIDATLLTGLRTLLDDLTRLDAVSPAGKQARIRQGTA